MGAAKQIKSKSEFHLADLEGFRERWQISEEAMSLIVSSATLEEFESGENILEQGTINHTIYLLLEGRAQIYVDGNLLSELGPTGDIFGEMSVLSAQPCSATVYAASPVRVLAIDPRHLHQQATEESYQVLAELYRVYALVLSEKLSKTNIKAKAFELTNLKLVSAQDELEEMNRNLEKKVQERSRELIRSYQELEQQHLALVTSQNKLKDLNALKRSTFEKLQSLHRDYLPSLNRLIDRLGADKEVSHHSEFRQMHEQLNSIGSLLSPLINQFDSEMNLVDKKVLIAESNKKDQIVAKMALGGTGVQLKIVDDLGEAKTATVQNLDAVLFSPDLAEAVSQLAKDEKKAQFVLFTDSEVSDYLPILRKYDFIDNVISQDSENRSFTVKNILTTVNKMVNRDVFGLEKYLSWGVEVFEEKVSDSNQRIQLLKNMEERLQAIGLRRSVTSRCAVVAEELLMNAVYDAPLDSQGQPKYNHLSRQTRVTLQSNEFGVLRYACDGMVAALSVEDPFGALKKDTILNYLEANYMGRSGHAKGAKKGGAGRGLHQMLENADLLIFNVAENVKTEVIALFNLGMKREEKTQRPSFQFFFQ